jgi:acyl-CoA synthetase (NDP forming)
MQGSSDAPSRRAYNEFDAKRLLQQYGVPTVREAVVHSEAEALEQAATIGYPVVLKGLGSDLLHKSEQALVELNLSDAAALQSAFMRVSQAGGHALDGYLLQPYIDNRREFAAGVYRDPLFGPVVMFGLGGIFVEALADSTFRVAPLTPADVDDMLTEIKASAMWGAYRGLAAAKPDQLHAVLLALSSIAMQRPEIAEIDINPLALTPTGEVLALDALVVESPATERIVARPKVSPRALRKFFYPRSIAFVGASAQLGKWGHMLVTNTLSGGYQGDIYLINPKGGMIAGKRVYRSLEEIPDNIDLGVVTIPAGKVLDLMPQFKAKGIRHMLLITSGFGEIGPDGKSLEKKLVDAATKADIVILGPNTMGICNPHIHLNCTSLPVNPKPGHTALVSQSGNMGVQFLAFAEKQGLGIRGFCGSGNEAMMAIEDFLEAFETDDLTRTVMLYVESISDGRRFIGSAKRLSQKLPVVLLKGGQTEAGRKAASSHTGALAADQHIFNAACRQAGIVKVEKSMDLLDLAAGFSTLPLPQGHRAAIMTLGGGWGVVTSDLCGQYGIEVPELSDELIQAFDQWLPAYWSRTNPIDLVGETDTDLPFKILEALLRWDGCDAVINLGILGRALFGRRYAEAVSRSDPQYPAQTLDAVQRHLRSFESDYITHTIGLMARYRKPVYGVALLMDHAERTIFQGRDDTSAAVFYATPERAVRTFAKMAAYQQFLSRKARATATV